MTRLDQALISAFTTLGESVDRITCFKTVRRLFVEQLPLDLRSTNDDDVCWRLLLLRKSGQLLAKHKEN